MHLNSPICDSESKKKFCGGGIAPSLPCPCLPFINPGSATVSVTLIYNMQVLKRVVGQVFDLVLERPLFSNVTSYEMVTFTIQRSFDGRSTAYQRSLRSR